MNHGLIDRQATPEDILTLYLILLGRYPENTKVVEDKSGLSLFRLILEFVHSEEFTNIIANAIIRDELPHYLTVKQADYTRTARWISRLTSSPLPDFESWWLYVDTILQLDAVLAEPPSADIAAFHALARTKVDAESKRSDLIAPFVSLDTRWFRRYHGRTNPSLAHAGAQEIAAQFMSGGLKQNHQLLPAIANGYETVYRKASRDPDAMLPDVLTELSRGLRAGTMSHWLFAGDYYRDILLWQEDSEHGPDRATIADSELYLDFLTHGDKLRYNPHALFCHHAYRTLNAGYAPKHEHAFRDYITNGCFEDARTSILFDTEFYLASNPAAHYALVTGTHISALHHFLTHGIFADFPFLPDFDIHHYRETYPDIAMAVQAGSIPSVTWHFVNRGLREGRTPNPYFNPAYYRDRQPHASSEMKRFGIRTELEHFLMIGKARGYKPERPLMAGQPQMQAAKAVFQRRTRRSFNNLTQKPLDFTPFTGGVGPATTAPAISIIVPVYNEVEFTARFLECAYFAAAFLLQTTGKRSEIIIVDNGSEDGTDALLRSCAGIRIVSFPGPIGFPRAVNAGVAQSRGGIVVVANNDIEFMPDVFAKVCARLNASPKIGVLGGLTILPNETLQEAGSFLDSKGGVIGLGRHENPWDQYFQGVNRADYCTGSFISFRRADYDELDGLDEAFSPGYYEETDFTFRMFEHLGKSAAVDSEIQVNHFEHASFGKGRPPTTAYALIKKNQSRFVGKNRDAIATRPAPLELVTDQGARPAVIGRTRFLVIEDLMPDARLGSGFVRSSQILAGLTKHGVAYDLLVLQPSALVDDYRDPLVTVYRAWMPHEDVDTVLSRHAARYSHVMVCRTHNLVRLAGQLEHARQLHGLRIICDTEALSVLRSVETRRLNGDTVSRADQVEAVRLELTAPVKVSRWITVSPYEEEQMAEAGVGPVTLLSHLFDRPAATALKPLADRHRIIAVGAMHDIGSPNHDGLTWFMDRILPRCRDVVADLTLTLVGLWHPDARKSFEGEYPGITIDFAGTVSEAELDRLYGESVMALAPTRFAAGVAAKVLQAMMRGVPIVVTDLLAKQLVGADAVAQSGLAIGRRDDDGESYADWVSRLATDEAAWHEVQARQYDAATPLAGSEPFDRGMTEMLAAVGVPGRGEGIPR